MTGTDSPGVPSATTTNDVLLSVCVFCGSSPGARPTFSAAAASLGAAIAKRGLGLVYGGGEKGIMGVVSASALSHGSAVTGIMPRAMAASSSVSSAVQVSAEGTGPSVLPATATDPLDAQRRPGEMRTEVVESMHERKTRMAELSAGFIGLPGGFGTFEEILEMVTWSQIGIHRKPVVLLNVDGFFTPLRDLVTTAVRAGFIAPENASLLHFVDEPATRGSDASGEATPDWGDAALEALLGARRQWEEGTRAGVYKFDWSQKEEGARRLGLEDS